MKILLTGIAGFVGMHTAQHLQAAGHEIIGIDNLNDYYDQSLKLDRLKELGIHSDSFETAVWHEGPDGLKFQKLDLTDKEGLLAIFKEFTFDCVINLAAQAGVRYSVTHPDVYIESNLVGYFNLLECARLQPQVKFIYASSSSIYGLNTETPFTLDQKTESPASLYAATKKSNELLAHSYSHLYGIKTMGIRFFTVYGPWGRPDMALFKFTRNILDEKPIEVYNNGEMYRDFTYVDDIARGIVNIVEREWHHTYNIQNIGKSKPVKLSDFVHLVEKETGKKAIIEYKPLQAGDVEATWADVSGLQRDFGYTPEVELPDGVVKFVKWYREYYNI